MSATGSTSLMAEHGEPRPRLRANTTGWIGAAALGAIIMSPAGGFYILAMIVLPGIFALFFNEFLSYFGVATGFGTWVIGILVTTGVVIAFDFFGVKITIRGTEIFMLAESIILFALAITILAVGGFHHHLTAAPFNPGTALGGCSAIFGALIFGIQANVGYDSLATLAE